LFTNNKHQIAASTELLADSISSQKLVNCLNTMSTLIEQN